MPFGLEPVVAIVSAFGSARLPPRMCLFGDLGEIVHFLVHEQQIVGLEVMEPLVTDRPQPRKPGEVEPKAGFPIIDIERLGTGGRRFTSGWLSMVTTGPARIAAWSRVACTRMPARRGGSVLYNSARFRRSSGDWLVIWRGTHGGEPHLVLRVGVKRRAARRRADDDKPASPDSSPRFRSSRRCLV